MAIKEESLAAGFENGFFNVEQAVGWYELGTRKPAPNQYGDMMLTAYFLQYLYRFGQSIGLRASQAEIDTIVYPANIPYLMTTSRKQTIEGLAYWIKRYQKDLNSGATNRYLADGRVDRAKGHLTAVTKSAFSIHALNINYSGVIKDVFMEDDWQGYLMSDTFAPSQLKYELSR